MELSHRVVMVLSAQVQRQTNKTASEMLSSLKFKSLPTLELFDKPITTIRLLYLRPMAYLISPIIRLITNNAVVSYRLLTEADATQLPVEHKLLGIQAT